MRSKARDLFLKNDVEGLLEPATDCHIKPVGSRGEDPSGAAGNDGGTRQEARLLICIDQGSQAGAERRPGAVIDGIDGVARGFARRSPLGTVSRLLVLTSAKP